MEKIKVSQEVADFIKKYEDNVASYNGWENHLLMEHCRAFFTSYEGCKEEALVMKNIEPIQLAEMLIKGYKIEDKYTEGSIPKYFQFKVNHNRNIYNAVMHNESVYVAWEYEDVWKGESYSIQEVLFDLNKGNWLIVK